jgi:hypothetical protein
MLIMPVIARALGVGSVLAKTGDGAINQARILVLQALKIQPITLEPAHLEVLHQDVGLCRHLANQRLAFGLGHVDGDGALVAVASGEVGGVGGVVAVRVLKEGRAPVAGVVPRTGALDLDHIGPQVGQHLGAPGAGEYAREVEDFEVG